jgi:cytochrome c oxidase subunit 3
MTTHTDEHYYVPHGSHWPAVGSLGLLFLMVGVSSWLNGADFGFYVMLTGLAVIIFMITGWFGTVIGESQGGLYNDQVDKSFRQGMFWFIFSEVMFFAAFFGALFYARNMSIPWLGGDSNNFFTNLLLWEGYESSHAAVRPAADQYGAAADFFNYRNDRAPCPDCRQACAARHLPGRNLPARLRVRLFTGCRVHSCLP